CYGKNAHVACETAFGECCGKHRTDNDDGRDGIGDCHERRMQRGSDIPHDVESDIDRQHENDDVDKGGIDSFHQALLNTLPSLHIRQAVTISSSCWMANCPSGPAMSF